MTPGNGAAFFAVLDQLFSVLGHGNEAKSRLSPAAKSLWFNTLKPWSLEVVVAAIEAHLRRPSTGRTLPIPGDIVAQIEGAQANDGRPGADAAWAAALRAQDEGNTVVWTVETAEAWKLAKSVLDRGDEVGARVAFRDEYNRTVDNARRARRLPQWTASLGHDRERRALALQDAARRGIAVKDMPGDVLLALPVPVDMTLDRLMLGELQSSVPIATKEIAGRPNPARVAEMRAACARIAAHAASRTYGSPSTDVRSGEAAKDARRVLQEMDARTTNSEPPKLTGRNSASVFVNADPERTEASNWFASDPHRFG